MEKRGLKNRFVLVLMLSISAFSYGQDIHFSQFDMAPLQQNPALAGALYGMQASINYKDQWRSVGSPYRTFAAGFDMRLTKKRTAEGFLTMGAHLFSDKSGDSQMGTTLGSLSIGYHVKLNEFHNLGAAIQPGFFQRSMDFTYLQWGNQYDGMQYNAAIPSGEMQGNTSFTKYDLGTGLLWSYSNTRGNIKVTDNHSKSFHLGVSLFHLTRSKYSFLNTGEKLYMKFVLHGGGVFAIGDTKMAFCPGFFYYRQGPAQELYMGGMIRTLLSQDSKYTGFKNASALYVGAYYRGYFTMSDAITARLMYEYSGWGFGVSYDFNISSLNDATRGRGGLELSLRVVTSLNNAPGSTHSRY